MGHPAVLQANGTLIYFMPWDNLGFFYDVAGGHDDRVVLLGRVEAGMEHLDRLERGSVTVEVVA